MSARTLIRDPQTYFLFEQKSAVQSRGAVCLLPDLDIYAWTYAGDGEKFVRCFRDTWTRLPLRARRPILKHWRDVDFNHPRAVYSPQIELISDRRDWEQTDEHGLPGMLGTVSRKGHRIRFYSEFIDAAPDNVVSDLIAHELCHVLQFAHGFRFSRYDEGGNLLTRVPFAFGEEGEWMPEEVENDADEMMEKFGFDKGSIDGWLDETEIAEQRERAPGRSAENILPVAGLARGQAEQMRARNYLNSCESSY